MKDRYFGAAVAVVGAAHCSGGTMMIANGMLFAGLLSLIGGTAMLLLGLALAVVS